MSNRERVGRAFEMLATGLAPYVDERMRETSEHGERWLDRWRQHVRGQEDATLDDPAMLLRVMADCWEIAFKGPLGRGDRNLVFELRDVRNGWAHNKAFSADDAYRALDSVERLLAAIGASETSEVGRSKEDLMRLRYEADARRAAPRGEALTSAPAAGLKPWREVIAPHEDVAQGKYAIAEFAADLWQVHRGEATAEYVDPVEFFGRTYLTAGLRTLLADGVERIRGGGGVPIVDLQTNFGGGKTHSMIALYHLFSGRPTQAFPQEIQEMLGDAELPAVRRAVLVGTRLSPGQPDTSDGRPAIRTIWGELAWQLGGADLFAKIAESDRAGTNPGNAIQEVLAAAAPCLLLIDEWVGYARQLYLAPEPLPAGSFDVQFTFAQMLTEAVKAVPGALLVVSLPASDSLDERPSGASPGSAIELGGPGGRESLDRLRNVIGRTGSSWRPASAEEGFEIVRRRLFRPIEPALLADRDATARMLGELYRANAADFPAECREPGYVERIKAAYPIHPELFDRLYDDWSTLERFQRTRGVLRLLAAVVASLWEGGDHAPIIMPASVSLADSKVSGELERNLEDRWKPIIDTDIDGPTSLPGRLDGEVTNLGRYQAARRVARTVFLGSAPTVHSPNRGIDAARVRLGCVLPNEAIPTFGDALNRLSGAATYLYVDNNRYWFGAQPSVARIARERAERQLAGGRDEVHRQIVTMLREDTRARGVFASVPVAPEGSGEVLDEPGVRLVVLGPAHSHIAKADISGALTAAGELLDRRGTGAREHRNALVFLAPDHRRLEELERGVAEALAWESVHEEAGADGLNLDPNQTRQARTKSEDAARTAKLRLAETYQWVLAPEQPDPTGSVTWSAVRVDGTDPLAVRAGRKLVSSGQLNERFPPALLRMALDGPIATLWEVGHVDAGRVWDTFSRYVYLPRLLNQDVLLGAVAEGPASLAWQTDGFAVADGYDGSRYVGLITGGGMATASASSLLVRPEHALRQIESDGVAGEEGVGDDTPGGLSHPTVDPETETGSVDAGPPTHFWAMTEISGERPIRDLGNLTQEVIQPLASLDGVTLRVRVEIEAVSADGFCDGVVRTVQENADTLKVAEHGFGPS